MLTRVGIRLANPRLPSAVLGSEYVSLLSLTAAYATFANGGVRPEPFAIRYARNGKGEFLYRRPPVKPAEPAFAERPRCDIMKMMRSVTSANGSGKNAAFGHPVWGKTGTSGGYRDALFVGFTGHYVAAIWLGRQAPGQVAAGVSGGDLPAKTFRKLMATLHVNKPVIDLDCRVRFATGRAGAMQ